MYRHVQKTNLRAYVGPQTENRNFAVVLPLPKHGSEPREIGDFPMETFALSLDQPLAVRGKVGSVKRRRGLERTERSAFRLCQPQGD